MSNSNKPLCDYCMEVGKDHQYIGYGMMFCKKCTNKQLVKVPNGFRLKTQSEKMGDTTNDKS